MPDPQRGVKRPPQKTLHSYFPQARQSALEGSSACQQPGVPPLQPLSSACQQPGVPPLQPLSSHASQGQHHEESVPFETPIQPMCVEVDMEGPGQPSLVEMPHAEPNAWHAVTTVLQDYVQHPCKDVGGVVALLSRCATALRAPRDLVFTPLLSTLNGLSDDFVTTFIFTSLPNMLQICLSPYAHLRRLRVGEHKVSVTMSPLDAFQYLSMMFFGLFFKNQPWYRSHRRRSVINTNFTGLFSLWGEKAHSFQLTSGHRNKIICILSYFNSCSNPEALRSSRRISITRFAYSSSRLKQRQKSRVLENNMKLHLSQSIEDIEAERGQHVVHLDFANRVLGGGVLGRGLVQEEIRFITAPECILSRLVCDPLDDDEFAEVVIISGAACFCKSTGYRADFQYVGRTFELLPPILAVDAYNFGRDARSQWSPHFITREYRKFFAAVCATHEFFSDDQNDIIFSTGHWGCGAFGGDRQLKFLLQWLATLQFRSDRKVHVAYCCFGDETFVANVSFFLQGLLRLRSIQSEELWKYLARLQHQPQQPVLLDFPNWINSIPVVE